MFATLLALALGSALAAPGFEVDVHAQIGPGGSQLGGRRPDAAGFLGISAMAWPSSRLGLGLRLDGGTFTLIGSDDSNLFGSLEGAVRLSDQWSAGLGLVVPLVQDRVECIVAPCPSGPWSHSPLGAAQVTRDVDLGALHLPLSLRAELGQQRWTLGLGVGLGLRAGG